MKEIRLNGSSEHCSPHPWKNSTTFCQFIRGRWGLRTFRVKVNCNSETDRIFMSCWQQSQPHCRHRSTILHVHENQIDFKSLSVNKAPPPNPFLWRDGNKLTQSRRTNILATARDDSMVGRETKANIKNQFSAHVPIVYSNCCEDFTLYLLWGWNDSNRCGCSWNLTIIYEVVFQAELNSKLNNRLLSVNSTLFLYKRTERHQLNLLHCFAYFIFFGRTGENWNKWCVGNAFGLNFPPGKFHPPCTSWSSDFPASGRSWISAKKMNSFSLPAFLRSYKEQQGEETAQATIGVLRFYEPSPHFFPSCFPSKDRPVLLSFDREGFIYFYNLS